MGVLIDEEAALSGVPKLYDVRFISAWFDLYIAGANEFEPHQCLACDCGLMCVL